MYWPGNYRKNASIVLPEAAINGQGLPPYAQLRYGLATVKKSGCGPVAVYNAMRQAGCPVAFAKVLREMELVGAAFAGTRGTYVFLIGLFFHRRHIPCRLTFSRKKLFGAQRGIVAFRTRKNPFAPGHIVYFERQTDGALLVYNRYGNVRGICHVKPEELVKPWCLQGGYCL